MLYDLNFRLVTRDFRPLHVTWLKNSLTVITWHDLNFRLVMRLRIFLGLLRVTWLKFSTGDAWLFDPSRVTWLKSCLTVAAWHDLNFQLIMHNMNSKFFGLLCVADLMLSIRNMLRDFTFFDPSGVTWLTIFLSHVLRDFKNFWPVTLYMTWC